MTPDQFKNVDAYISSFPLETHVKLQQLRELILKAAPEAEELISYQMPAYKYKGMLVYFAGYKGHIGFYPTGAGVAPFLDKLAAYKTSKGTVQFPLDKALPVLLIMQMVKYRVKENAAKAASKKR